jgi:hypothetical protein
LQAISEVREAFERGAISAKRADLLLYLGPHEQRAELERRLSAAREREERHRRAAKAIRTYLNGLGPQGRVDLHQLAGICARRLLEYPFVM